MKDEQIKFFPPFAMFPSVIEWELKSALDIMKKNTAGSRKRNYIKL